MRHESDRRSRPVPGAPDVPGRGADVFGFDEAADRVVVLEERPDESLRDEVAAAVRYCPAMALTHRGGLMERDRGWRSSGARWLDANRRPSRPATGGDSRTSTPRTRRTAGCTPPTSTSWPLAVSRSVTMRSGTEMAGLDGWHYDYVATVMDEGNRWSIGFWRQRAGIDDEQGREYEMLGIGGSWFGLTEGDDGRRDRLAARLVRPRLGGRDLPRRGRLREGAAGSARPDGPGRPVPARPLPARRPAVAGVAPPVEAGQHITQEAHR